MAREPLTKLWGDPAMTRKSESVKRQGIGGAGLSSKSEDTDSLRRFIKEVAVFDSNPSPRIFWFLAIRDLKKHFAINFLSKHNIG